MTYEDGPFGIGFIALNLFERFQVFKLSEFRLFQSPLEMLFNCRNKLCSVLRVQEEGLATPEITYLPIQKTLPRLTLLDRHTINRDVIKNYFGVVCHNALF